jgi:hypothetical protein
MSHIRKTQAKYGAKIPAARDTGAKANNPAPVSTQPASHIEPSRHSSAQVDEFLDMVEGNIEATPGAGSPATKPNSNLDEDGKPATDTPRNPNM